MKKEKICGIYSIVNNCNNKMYIGQSYDIYNRWITHKAELRHNRHHNNKLQNAWNKYGEENFKFEIILKCSIDDLDKYEQEYIKKYNTYYEGYNLDFGGTNKVRWTDEMRKNLREIRLNMTDEERTKYRISHKNEAIPILQIDFDGNIIKKWDYGAREASKVLNIEQSCIWNCVNHKRKTYKKYIWISCKEYNKDIFNINDYITHMVNPAAYNMYDVNNNLIKHFKNYGELSKNGLDPSGVLKCCNGKTPTYKGYIFKKVS